jgi:hypothetical protein
MAQERSPIVMPDEFNDPLQAILANTEAAILLLSSGRPDIDKIKAALEDVRSEVGRVTQITHGCTQDFWSEPNPSDLIGKRPVLAPRIPSGVRTVRCR